MGCPPANQKVIGLIPSQGTCLCCRPGPNWICVRQPINVPLLSFSLPSPLSKNKSIQCLKTINKKRRVKIEKWRQSCCLRWVSAHQRTGARLTCRLHQGVSPSSLPSCPMGALQDGALPVAVPICDWPRNCFWRKKVGSCGPRWEEWTITCGQHRCGTMSFVSKLWSARNRSTLESKELRCGRRREARNLC